MAQRPAKLISIGLTAGPLLALPVMLAACATAPSQDDAIASTVHMCSSCHGPEGRSISPTFPRLAGQQKEYLSVQLKAFRDHTRADPHAHTYMCGMAARLSDQTIDGLAAYYASQTPEPGTQDNSPAVAAGKTIFENGVPDRDIPACNGCHGDQAQGIATFPRLAGQHRPYIEVQLAAFASNSRANEIMHENAKNLTEEQIHALAAFLATQ
jgi:cytochrome c553